MAGEGPEKDSFDMQFMFRTMAERDPNKRKVKPASQAFMDLGPMPESSSDDSDYEIAADQLNEDSEPISDSATDSPDGSGDEGGVEDRDGVGNEEETGTAESDGDDGERTVEDLLKHVSEAYILDGDASKGPPPPLICGVCYGDVSLPNDELIECDGCGVTVHEGCYGISDVGSVGSSVSSCSTEPWFCDSCKAGNFNPRCELCPNKGGVFKETDVGQWVHLACALFVPGVAFQDVDALSGITLFEMNYSAYGAKACSLCEDAVLSRSGVCIACDAGLCRTSFHVSCAQREGLLQFPQEDGNLPMPGEQVDPYIAHCKVHSDKAKMKKKRRMFLAMQTLLKRRKAERLRRNEDARKSSNPLPPEMDPQRLLRKLTKHRTAYENAKTGKPQPWVPTDKIVRSFSTSAEAVVKMRHKATLMGIDPLVAEDVAIQQQSIADIRRKWHVQPAFTVEFVAYCLDRSKRITDLRAMHGTLVERKSELAQKASQAFEAFQEAKARNEAVQQRRDDARQEAEFYNGLLNDIVGETLPTPKCLEPPLPAIRPFFASPVRASNQARQMNSFVTQAAEMGLKRAASKKSTSKKRGSEGSKLQLLACATCSETKDQHLIVTCDTCHQSYHLGCVDPPLAKMPKKTKLYGWQCTSCVQHVSSDSDADNVDTEAPRKLRGAVTRPRKFWDDLDGYGAGAAASSSAAGEGSYVESVDGSGFDGIDGANQAKRRPFSGQKRKYVRKPTPEAAFGNGGTASTAGAADGATHGVSGRGSLAMSATAGGDGHKRDQGSSDFATTTANMVSGDGAGLLLSGGDRKVGTGGGNLLFSTATLIISKRPSTSVSVHVPKSALDRETTSNGTHNEAMVRAHSTLPPLSSIGSPSKKRRRSDAAQKRGTSDNRTRCDVCSGPGTNANLVRCDECKKCFHFMCLDPPVTKSPKVRGYSWHCEDCDKASDTSVKEESVEIGNPPTRTLRKNRARTFYDGPTFSALKKAPNEKRRSALRELDGGKDPSRTSHWVAETAANTAAGNGMECSPSTYSSDDDEDDDHSNADPGAPELGA